LIKKLDRKGFVEKGRDPENHTRTLIALSEKGRIAFDNHLAYHRERDGDFFRFLEMRSGEELDLFNDFLKEFLKMYP
jgi:DNA-binding MarR family transcriptional regulator